MPARPELRWSTHADLAIDRRPCVRREEYLDHMTFRANERPLFTEIFGPIVGLKEEWLAQGATPGELDFSAFRYRCPRKARVAVSAGVHGGRPEQTLEETDDHRIYRDALGRTMKLNKGVATLPLPLDFPVRTMDDWRRLKPLYTFDESRLAGDWARRARADREAGCTICLAVPGAWEAPRELMGDAQACMAYYDDPELMHDILATIADTATAVLDRVTREVTVDVILVHEDLAGKSGPLVGPTQVEQFMAPFYRRVWDLASQRGARLFDQDSDGDTRPVMDAFLAAGVNCMHPMEPAAGMDIVEVRATYGRRLAFAGGIDKYVLSRSRAEIDAELERKIPPMLATGGCVLGLDHRIPNGTPLENYRYYIRRVWEMLEG